MENKTTQLAGGRIRIGFKQAAALIGPYVWKKVKEQIKSIWLIILYLILFQTFILRMAVDEAAVIGVGIGVVIIGLALFMEGLLLGLMPLGEVIGLRLPRKSKLPSILIFSFILGVGATFAEPAVGVLKTAGASIKAWDAPLLFLLLNKHSDYLVYAVGIGVGLAVMAGMLRFMYNLSLKPFIYVLIGGLSLFTVWAYFDPNLRHLTGLAWDCGAVTTGPVTVPLVLALGIGICRVVSGSSKGGGGFGVVTLASLFPILAVLCLGAALNPTVLQPMDEGRFYSPDNRTKIEALFENRDAMLGYAFLNARGESQERLFDDGRSGMLEELNRIALDTARQKAVFGPDPDALFRWTVFKGTDAQRLAVFGNEDAIRDAVTRYAAPEKNPAQILSFLQKGVLIAIQAIVPLTLFLLLVLTLFLQEKLPRADEILLGIGLGIAGMALFSIGIDLGLAKLGNQVGGKVPALFKSISLEEQRNTLVDFDPAAVETAVTPQGEKIRFFFLYRHGAVQTVPYDESGYDVSTKSYTFTPVRGPLFEGWEGIAGIAVLLLFAFIMGYGATLAEPALNALAITVEEITVGTFKKSLLMQAVAVGVGSGISLGVAKIVWGIPLMWLLVPPYLILLLLTAMSSEDYVNIGWDSAGVTTGPVTVPLVLAMGLGIGSQVGVVEGFGILAAASVCPILSVLLVGITVTGKRKKALREASGQKQGVRL
ncbi:MAG: DUF1538 family protein [Deltaproteobacteria bacterium]|nr:DUF1538 family protein [Deltaproteobacteria bacterium]